MKTTLPIVGTIVTPIGPLSGHVYRVTGYDTTMPAVRVTVEGRDASGSATLGVLGSFQVIA